MVRKRQNDKRFILSFPKAVQTEKRVTILDETLRMFLLGLTPIFTHVAPLTIVEINAVRRRPQAKSHVNELTHPGNGQSEDDPRRTSPIVAFLASNLHLNLFTCLPLQPLYPSFPEISNLNFSVLKSGRALKAPFPLCASIAERPSACRLVISTKTLRPFLVHSQILSSTAIVVISLCETVD